MKLALSILSADFGCLAEEIRKVEDAVDFLHLDVMDGHFVPNLSFGPPLTNALRKYTQLPFEVHLMIEHPIRYAPRFRVGLEDVMTFHVEAQDPPRRRSAPSGVLVARWGSPCARGPRLRPSRPTSIGWIWCW